MKRIRAEDFHFPWSQGQDEPLHKRLAVALNMNPQEAALSYSFSKAAVSVIAPSVHPLVNITPPASPPIPNKGEAATSSTSIAKGKQLSLLKIPGVTFTTKEECPPNFTYPLPFDDSYDSIMGALFDGEDSGVENPEDIDWIDEKKYYHSRRKQTPVMKDVMLGSGMVPLVSDTVDQLCSVCRGLIKSGHMVTCYCDALKDDSMDDLMLQTVNISEVNPLLHPPPSPPPSSTTTDMELMTEFGFSSDFGSSHSPKTSGMVTPEESSESDEEIIDVESYENSPPLVAEQSIDEAAVSLINPPSTAVQQSLVKANRPMRSVLRPTIAAKKPKGQSGYLPKTTSLCAQVAAMHNYSSASSSAPTMASSGSRNYRTAQAVGSVLSTVRNGERRFKPLPTPIVKKAAKKKGRTNARSVNLRITHEFDDESTIGPDCTTEVGKRAYHNVLERRRRHELQNSTQILRMQVPELAGMAKAPKMAILQKAAMYCEKLRLDHERLQRSHEKEARRNATLRKIYEKSRHGLGI